MPREEHPHGVTDMECGPVIFGYHGHPWLVHHLAYRRTGHPNLHVRGYKEMGTAPPPSTWSCATTWTATVWWWT